MKAQNKFRQQQQGNLTAQQIQFFSFLQTPDILMTQKIQEEVEKNPFLEWNTSEAHKAEQKDELSEEDISPVADYEQDRDEVYHSRDTLPSEINDRRLLLLTHQKGFQEYISEFLTGAPFDETQRMIALVIWDNLDKNGLLTKTDRSITDELLLQYDMEVSPEGLAFVLDYIQQGEPAGVAARSVSECLQRQLRQLPSSAQQQLALRVVTEGYEWLLHKKYDKIISTLKVDKSAFKEALALIKTLRPYPFYEAYRDKKTQTLYMQPDFTVTQQDDMFQVQLVKTNNSLPRISTYYHHLLDRYRNEVSASSKETLRYLEEKLQQAAAFLENIRQRDTLLLKAMEAIAAWQQAYFSTQDPTQLKPLLLKDMAAALGINISTMSRIVHRKYVQTDFGVFPLKHFFVRGLERQDEPLHQRGVQLKIQQVIASEDKRRPLTDDQIRAALAVQQITISRRTVTKYRELSGIPNARLRKEL